MTDKQYKVSGIILAGGESKRFGGGVNKAFLPLGGKTIIRRIIDTLRPLFDEIIVVTNKEQTYRQLPVKLVKDVCPGYGSLSGLHSGLFHAANFYSFVCACDSPFIRPELVEYLIKKRKNYDVVIPWLGKRPGKSMRQNVTCFGGQQPFAALYSKNCLAPIKELIGEKVNPKIIDFFPAVKVRKISEKEVKKVDRQLISFFNINTWDEYRKAETIIREEKQKKV